MKRRLFLPVIVLLFSGLSSYAYGRGSAEETKAFKSNTCHTDFGSYAVTDGSDAKVVSDFITRQLPHLQNRQTPVLLTFTNTSPGGYHYTFTQTYAGVPVFASDVTVNVSKGNRVYSIFDDSYDISAWRVDMTDFRYQSVPAFQSFVRQHYTGDVKQTAKKVVAFDENTDSPELCYLMTVNDNHGQQLEILTARDRVIFSHDDRMHHRAAAAPDSLVTGMVFRPDPLTTAHVDYYAPYLGHDSAYQNYNDSDTYQLNVQREQRSFYADYNAGTFSLSNKYIQLTQLGGDQVAPVTSTTPTFNYTRSQNGFLDVMVFYHLNVIRDYVHSLGFNMGDTLVTPDPHALSADDDFFSAPNTIWYGTGGVPDCQDADVIVHEYTHFLSWNANQSNNGSASSQRGSIDEGSADYNGSSYSASIDTFRWYNMFTWDGHNEFWPGRYVKDPTVYPNIPNAAGLNGIYKYSVIWSSALMQIWWDIGRGPADSLFFECLYGLGSNITLPDAAQQYIKADSLLYGGRYHCTIVRDFHDHGLAVDAACGVYPTGVNEIKSAAAFTFTAYPDGFKASPSEPNASLDITLYDIAGQRLAAYHNITSEIRPDLPSGIYIIDVASGGAHQGYKWPLVK